MSLEIVLGFHNVSILRFQKHFMSPCLLVIGWKVKLMGLYQPQSSCI